MHRINKSGTWTYPQAHTRHVTLVGAGLGHEAVIPPRVGLVAPVQAWWVEGNNAEATEMDFGESLPRDAKNQQGLDFTRDGPFGKLLQHCPQGFIVHIAA